MAEKPTENRRKNKKKYVVLRCFTMQGPHISKKLVYIFSRYRRNQKIDVFEEPSKVKRVEKLRIKCNAACTDLSFY